MQRQIPQPRNHTIPLHSRKNKSCQTWDNFRPILLVFPSTDHELAKGVTHEFDRDQQEWRAVGVKEDNEKPSKDLNARVQAFGGMTPHFMVSAPFFAVGD